MMETLQPILEFLARNVWLSFGLLWILVIVAFTEFSKALFDIVKGEDHPKRKPFLKLIPFLLGPASGWYVVPMVSDTTAFASLGWVEGLFIGPVGSVLAIGAYELSRETRPLRMLKVFIRGVFRFVMEKILRRKMTAEETAELDRTQKRAAVDLPTHNED